MGGVSFCFYLKIFLLRRTIKEKILSIVDVFGSDYNEIFLKFSALCKVYISIIIFLEKACDEQYSLSYLKIIFVGY